VNKDRGGSELLLQAVQFLTQPGAQGRVQGRERLIEQKKFRWPHQGAR
jgi:hypothetical protein